MSAEVTCSIVIPTKDRPTSLVAAVISALAALPEGGEILVVDDGGSIPAAQSLSGLPGDRLRVLVNPGPHGPSQARNYGVAQARGDVIFFLDDDDEFLADYCRRVLARRYPDDCVYGYCAPLHAKAEGGHSYHGRDQETGVYGGDARLVERLGGLGMGFWIRREVFAKLGGIDPSLRVNEDTEFCIRLASLGYSCFYDATAGVLLRQDHVRPAGDVPSITRSARSLERALGFEYILEKHQDYLLRHPGHRRQFLGRVIKYRCRACCLDGFLEFAQTVRPFTDRLMLVLVGGLLLRGSIALRGRR